LRVNLLDSRFRGSDELCSNILPEREKFAGRVNFADQNAVMGLAGTDRY
jgi:hypothetical protein